MKPIPGLPIEEQPDDVLVTMCLWAEARGEGYLGMLAVLYVIMHRALKRGTTPGKEILRPWQFSSFNASDPNRGKLLTAWQTNSVSWRDAEAVLSDYRNGKTSDPTRGATHYCTAYLWGVDDSERIAAGKAERWHSKQQIDLGLTEETARIGHHVFGIAP